jgi:hypothetical protein
MLKKFFTILILSGMFSGLFALAQDFQISKKDLENPKVAVTEVFKVFKRQVKAPVTQTTVKIPYNITYNMKINGENYYVSEFQIIIYYKTRGNALYTDEKKYIIRFLLKDNEDKVSEEEIYTLEKETNYALTYPPRQP